MNVIDGLPAECREVVTDIVGGADEALLNELRTRAEPTLKQRRQVERILGSEFCRNLRPDYEPTERGVAIDNALGVFLLRWPIENPAPR